MHTGRLARCLLLMFGLTLLAAAPSPAAENRPNIVFILIDDLGWSDIGCYGNTFVETPHIDRLAGQGVRFTDFYAAGAVCSPTRASIQSGQYQARFGITDFIPGHWRPFEKLIVPEVTRQLPFEIVTPAEALSTVGYRTGYFGKWHLGDRNHNPDRQGYETMVVTGGRHFAPRFRTTPKVDVEDGEYLADFLTDQTVAFIEENRDEPFFVFLSHYAVHIPLEAKAQTVAKYEDKPKPETGINNPTYAAMIEHVDESVGRIMAKLDELDLAENTLLVFTSDNGGLRQTYTGTGEIVTSNAPLRGEKGELYEGGIRVPLIVRWPGVTPAGTVCDEPTISIDFWPTFAEAAGAELSQHQTIDGLSLLPVLRDPQASLDRQAIYFHYPHYHHNRPAGAIRAGDWKLIEYFEDGSVELFNLEEDISESRNVAGQYPDRAESLKRQLAQWRESVDARMPKPNPKHDPERADEWWSRRTGKPRAR
ncbi:sulfatase [Maioricimonas sp. JC845]|uniref:sulfatase n=1 Tax=Maioricimonas sp. JC845 TaxID=3232138 RepID=UPI003459618C